MFESTRANGILRSGGNRGQGLVDYALILVLVVIAAVASLSLFGGALSALFTNIVNSWP